MWLCVLGIFEVADGVALVALYRATWYAVLYIVVGAFAVGLGAAIKVSS